MSGCYALVLEYHDKTYRVFGFDAHGVHVLTKDNDSVISRSPGMGDLGICYGGLGGRRNSAILVDQDGVAQISHFGHQGSFFVNDVELNGLMATATCWRLRHGDIIKWLGPNGELLRLRYQEK